MGSGCHDVYSKSCRAIPIQRLKKNKKKSWLSNKTNLHFATILLVEYMIYPLLVEVCRVFCFLSFFFGKKDKQSMAQLGFQVKEGQSVDL